MHNFVYFMHLLPVFELKNCKKVDLEFLNSMGQ